MLAALSQGITDMTNRNELERLLAADADDLAYWVEGRCPNCGEDELDGARCYYCGWHDYNCGLCDDCRQALGETHDN